RDALPAELADKVDRLRLGPADQTLDAMSLILRQWRWAGKDIRPAIAPTIPTHCSDQFLCGCSRIARDFGVPLHSHVGESKIQALVG
ncbi:hypothetical protein, partial [Klebsiella oxytoca]|uniref:hypothetical protein n=1 Tax=Klebsiella oxytoca TaxID=571 RepID=UPI0019549A25